MFQLLLRFSCRYVVMLIVSIIKLELFWYVLFTANVGRSWIQLLIRYTYRKFSHLVNNNTWFTNLQKNYSRPTHKREPSLNSHYFSQLLQEVEIRYGYYFWSKRKSLNLCRLYPMGLKNPISILLKKKRTHDLVHLLCGHANQIYNFICLFF